MGVLLEAVKLEAVVLAFNFPPDSWFKTDPFVTRCSHLTFPPIIAQLVTVPALTELSV